MQTTEKQLENLQGIENFHHTAEPMIKGPDRDHLQAGQFIGMWDWYSLPQDQRNRIANELKSLGLKIGHVRDHQFEVIQLKSLQEISIRQPSESFHLTVRFSQVCSFSEQSLDP